MLALAGDLRGPVGQKAAHRLAGGDQPLLHLGADRAEAGRELVGTCIERSRALFEKGCDPVAGYRDAFLDIGADARQALHQAIRSLRHGGEPLVEFARDGLAGQRQLGRRLLAAAGDPLDQGLAIGGEAAADLGRSLVEQGGHLVAAVGKVRRERLGAVVEERGEALGGFLDPLQDLFGGLVHVGHKAFVRADHGGAQALGMGQHRLALGAEILDEAADLRLVVGIGPLEGGNFRMDDVFEFGRAGQGPFDAVAERGDFPTNRLADAGDPLRCDRLGLDQFQRHFGQGAAHEAQIRRTADHEGEGEEEKHRNEGARHNEGEIDLAGRIHRRIGDGKERIAIKLEGDEACECNPDDGDGERDPDGHARGAPRQDRIGHDRGAALFVIGGALVVGARRGAVADISRARRVFARGGGASISLFRLGSIAGRGVVRCGVFSHSPRCRIG